MSPEAKKPILFPELKKCLATAGGNYCAENGCFYARTIQAINQSPLAQPAKEKAAQEAESIARSEGCLKYK